MIKKRCVYVFAALGLVAFGLLLWTLLKSNASQVEKWKFDQIPEGATKAQVEEILGDPALAIGPRRKIILLPLTPPLPPGGEEIQWGSSEGVALLHFDANMKVIYKHWYSVND